MKTNKNITFNALNSYYINTGTMRINADYLNDAIIMRGENTAKFYNAYTKGNRKIHSIVWEIFADLVNDHIRTIESPYHQDHYASSEQLKKWLDQYGSGYDTLLPAIETFTSLRAEYRADN